MTDFIEHQPSLLKGLKECSRSIMESDMLREEEEEKEREEEQEEEEEEEEEKWEVPATVPEEEEGESGILDVCSHSPESLAWSLRSLELLLYLSLPPWVQAALLCNFISQIGLEGFHDAFPARLISYLLLPYTLPTYIFCDFTYRLLLRLRPIPKYVFWLWQDMKQIVLFITRVTVSSLKRNLADRFLPSFLQTPVPGSPSEDDGVPAKTPRMRRRSTLRVQLSGLSSCTSAGHPRPDGRALSFLLDLGLELGSHPDARGLPPSSEAEEEAAPTPTLSTSQKPAWGEIEQKKER